MTFLSMLVSVFTVAFALASCCILNGCSGGVPVAPSVPHTAYVTGGQQPIAGAHVYLLSMGESGIGSASTSMLQSGSAGVSLDTNGRGYVTSDGSGGFNFAGDYAACADPAAQVYALALGGNPGLTAGSNNAAILLAASLGPCGSLSPTQNLQIDELTTVAFATAFTTYAADPWNIGAPSALVPALSDAATAAANLVNLATGQANAAIGIATAPAATVNTLGNAAAACVNSASGISTACAALFAATTTATSTPGDTLTALLNLAANPGTAQQLLFNLGSGASPFAPSLTAPPADWTLAARLPATLSSTAGLTALGDSISTIATGNGATPVTEGYTQLLANLLGQPFINDSQGGDEAIDTAAKAWHLASTTNTGNPPLSLMIGTNDVNYGDPSLTNPTQQQAYHDTLMAAITVWLTPPANKLFPNSNPSDNPACSGSGWITDGSLATTPNGFGVFSSTIGAPFTCTFTTYGAPIFLWHLVDTSPGTASVSIDGTPCGTYSNTFPNYAGSHNGVYNTIAALRCPTAAGTHTVTVTLIAGAHVGFEGLGTPPADPLTTSAPPTMFSFGTLHQLNDGESVATLFYVKLFENLAAQLAADGYLIDFLNVRDHLTYNGTADPNSIGAPGSSCMANQLHPANCGHAQIAAVLKSVIP